MTTSAPTIGSISKGFSWWWEIDNYNYELAYLTVAIALLIGAWCLLVASKWNKRGIVPLPPGPRGLPLIGNLPFLKPDLHSYFAELAQTYGPIMSLRLGKKLCVVVGSSSLAKEVLRDQDTIFANRDTSVAGVVMTYGGEDIGSSPHWRMLRKVCISNVLNNANLDAFGGLRQQEIRRMVRTMYVKVGTPVPVGEIVFDTIFNTITSMIWGGSLKEEEGRSVSADFRQAIYKVIELASKPNISDFFPVLAWFDIQGIERRTKKVSLWFDRIFDRLIDRRLQMDKTEEGRANKDFLHLLLQLKEKGDPQMPLTINHVKGLMLDFVSGGNDTTSITLEWAMAEMMEHPETMRRAQEELDEVVGTKATVDETHLPKLHYLSAVVKEVLRLHPVAPLLVPRRPSQSCVVGGYLVPQGAQVLVNVWAIQRDPEAWDQPLKFQPERFMMSSKKFDYRGNDFHYLPFGSGRRICIGISLAERMLMYTLASLLHSFDWRLPEDAKLDLSDKCGVLIRMEKPLVAIPTARLSSPELYT